MTRQNPGKTLSSQEARQKINHYCAYQERNHQEVRDKLYSFGLRKDDVEELLTHLIQEGYLNEERFAKSYAGGKFRMKSWGRLKITRALEQKNLSAYCILSGLKEIDDSEYLHKLNELLKKKIDMTVEHDFFVKKNKVARYAIQKGYEPELVWNTVNILLPNPK